MRFNDTNYHLLLHRDVALTGRQPGALPRRTKYATVEAEEHGLLPMADYPSATIETDQVKDVIVECHAKKIFPMYHQEAGGWGPDWYQNGTNYCWAYSMTGSVMGCRAKEGLEHVLLSPMSLGWLVNWRNAGYYLDATIKGVKERGIAPMSMCPEHKQNPRYFVDGWEKEALKYRTAEWWDVETYRSAEESIVRQCLTILATGTPLYIAYNWWSHAVECVGLRWDEKERNNVVWLIQNSHGDGIIELTGSRGVPDEAYGVRATLAA